MGITLQKYQEVGVTWLSEKKRALLADDMGIGKTAQALYAARKIGAKTVIVVCPANVRSSWEDKVKDYELGYEVKILTSTDYRLIEGVNIVSYNLLISIPVIKALRKAAVDCLVLDEIHYLKNHKAKRTRRILGKGGLLDASQVAWGLTGTPVLNRPVELFSVLSAMYPEAIKEYATFFSFAQRYCQAYRGDWGWDYTGASNIKELAECLKPFMLRRLKKEVLKELPDVIYNKLVLNPTQEQEALLAIEFKAYLAGKSMDETDADVKKANEQLAIGKLSESASIIMDLLEAKEKVVVFVYHRHVARLLQECLSAYKPVLFYGGINEVGKKKALEDFINGTSRVFIGNIASSGTGIDGLQHATDTCVFVELMWTPALIEQAISRLNRIGQKNATNAYFIMYKGSVDMQIYAALMKKEKVINELLSEEKETIKTKMVNITREDITALKEDDMGVEGDLKRIADAVERIANMLSDKGAKSSTVECKATVNTTEVLNPEIVEPKAVEPAKAQKKTPKKAAEAEIKPAAVVPQEQQESTKVLTGGFNESLMIIQKAFDALNNKKGVVAALGKIFKHVEKKVGHRRVKELDEPKLQAEVIEMLEAELEILKAAEIKG